jgi:hypothetical protein
MTPQLPTPDGEYSPESRLGSRLGSSLGTPISPSGCEEGSQLSIPDQYPRELTQQVIIIKYQYIYISIYMYILRLYIRF